MSNSLSIHGDNTVCRIPQPQVNRLLDKYIMAQRKEADTYEEDSSPLKFDFLFKFPLNCVGVIFLHFGLRCWMPHLGPLWMLHFSTH
jgi:hypothetical protein